MFLATLGVVFLHQVACWSVLPIGEILSRSTIAFLLTLALAPSIATTPVSLSTVLFAVASGLLTGLLWAALFDIFALLGEAIDLQRGVSIASVYDPVAGGHSTIAELLRQFGIRQAALLGAFPAICESGVRFSQVLKEWRGEQWQECLTLLTGQATLLTEGMVAIAPLLVAMLGIDWVIGQIQRIAPGVQPLVDGVALKGCCLLMLSLSVAPLCAQFVNQAVLTTLRHSQLMM